MKKSNKQKADEAVVFFNEYLLREIEIIIMAIEIKAAYHYIRWFPERIRHFLYAGYQSLKTFRKRYLNCLLKIFCTSD